MNQNRRFLSNHAEQKCPKPCKQMKIIAKNRENFDMDSSVMKSFTLAFQPTYEYKSKVLAYVWFDFIVDTGSSLGLWIGWYNTRDFKIEKQYPI